MKTQRSSTKTCSMLAERPHSAAVPPSSVTMPRMISPMRNSVFSRNSESSDVVAVLLERESLSDLRSCAESEFLRSRRRAERLVRPSSSALSERDEMVGLEVEPSGDVEPVLLLDDDEVDEPPAAAAAAAPIMATMSMSAAVPANEMLSRREGISCGPSAPSSLRERDGLREREDLLDDERRRFFSCRWWCWLCCCCCWLWLWLWLAPSSRRICTIGGSGAGHVGGDDESAA